MFCPKCGNQIKGGSFCDHCGHSMQQNVEKIGRFSFSIRKLKIDKKIVLFLLFIVVLITGIFAYNWRTGELSERQIEKKLTVIWSILLNTDKEMINNYLTKDFIEKDDFSEGFTVDFFSTLNDDLKEQLENFEKNLIKESYRNKLQIGKLEWENVVEVLGEPLLNSKQRAEVRAYMGIRIKKITIVNTLQGNTVLEWERGMEREKNPMQVGIDTSYLEKQFIGREMGTGGTFLHVFSKKMENGNWMPWNRNLTNKRT